MTTDYIAFMAAVDHIESMELLNIIHSTKGKTTVIIKGTVKGYVIFTFDEYGTFEDLSVCE